MNFKIAIRNKQRWPGIDISDGRSVQPAMEFEMHPVMTHFRYNGHLNFFFLILSKIKYPTKFVKLFNFANVYSKGIK